LKVCPNNADYIRLGEWQAGLLYETIMNFPVDALRQNYAEQRKKAITIPDEDLIEVGYTLAQIAAMKGKKV
jgi:hypothetical protein